MPTLTIRHVMTYRYRRPVAFGEHRMMLRPRDSHDQRVIEASLEISPEPRSLRFVQDAFGNHVGIARFSGRSKELWFESTVCLEHSSSDAADLDLDDTAKTFPVVYSADEMPDLAYSIERHQPDPGNEVGRWAHQFLPPSGSIGILELLTRLSQEHQSRLPLPAAGSEGNPAAGGDAPTRPWQLPRFRHADDRGGALARFRRAVCIRISRRSARRSEGTHERLSSRVDPCLGANLFARARLDRFRPHERQRRQDRPCHRCGRP
jgi:Bacterial transglutaminase-like N-terminal region